MMWDFISELMAGFTVLMMLGMVVGFVTVMRYISYKERTALQAYDRLGDGRHADGRSDKEISHE